MAKQRTAAVVLGGGAPNGGLMAGALAAIYDGKKTFNEFYCSGAGAAVALVYLAPQGNKSSSEALHQLNEVAVDDAIYKWVPLGYKTFYKRGPLTVPFKQIGNLFKLTESSGEPPGLRRLYNDWVDLVVATITPSDLTLSSESLCAHFPFVDSVVDFAKLKALKNKCRFFMNAYCIESGKSQQFSIDTDDIGPEHFYAALSYPFIYPPTRIGNHHFYEGAAYDPLNFPKLHRQCCKNAVDMLLIVDILGAYQKALIRRPTNLFDAYGISILMPLVAMAGKDRARFTSFHQQLTRDARKENQRGRSQRRLYSLRSLTFNVSPSDYGTMCDWSHSNMQRLWQIGYESGAQFVKEFGDELPDRASDGPHPV